MDNKKNNEYYTKKIIADLEFVISHTKDITETQLKENEVLLDSVLFRLIQISENSGKLTEDYKERHRNIAWRAIRGMRNRIVHEYGSVDLSVVYHTVIDDLPRLLEQLSQII